MSAEGKVRMIGYYSGQGPDVIFNPQESTELVMVRVEGLIDAFYKALDRFVIDLFANLDKGIVEKRFDQMFHTLPFWRNAYNKVFKVHSAHWDLRVAAVP